MNTNGKVSYKLDYVSGRPLIFDSNGNRIDPAAYCDCQIMNFERWVDRNRAFAKSDVHLYFLRPVHSWDTNSGPFWSGPEQYQGATVAGCIEAQAQAILAFDPEARFFIRFGEAVPKPWAEAYPGEMQTTDSGHRLPHISYASELGISAMCRYVSEIIRYCEQRDWANRIVGYMYFPIGEGLTELATLGYVFDQSAAMQKLFQHYLQDIYGSDAALAAAWGDPAATLAQISVPTDREWQERCAQSLHWPDPTLMCRERDYYELQKLLFRKWIAAIRDTMLAETADRPALLGLDALKQPMLGWQLTLAFGRVDHINDPMCDYPEMTLTSGATDIGDILDEGGWDIIITPSDYTARSVGFGWESEGINDSLRLRNMARLVENDARTWIGAESETLGAFLTPAEVRAGLLRNTAWAVTRGHLHYWTVIGSWYFDDPKIHEVAIRTERRIVNAAANWPHHETSDAICLVLDDSSPLHENGTAGYQQIAALWQRHLGLAHCGLPYRVYLLSDLDHPDMPRYKTYLFPNLFELNSERLAMLRRTVLRDGNVVIFGPATGITDGHKLSAEWLSTLTETEFELINKQAPRRVMVHGNHPLTAPLPAALTYGDSFSYGPILIPTRQAVNQGGFTTLGSAATFWEINKPGLILKEFGLGAAGNGNNGQRGDADYAIVWSVAVPLPANLLRECARWAGSHIWCEEDDVIMASETVAAIHSVKSGPRKLLLPSARPVWDLLSGEKLGNSLTAIEIDVTAPETRLFYFGETDPFN